MSGKICVRNLLKIAAGIFLGMNGAFRNRVRFFIFDDSRTYILSKYYPLIGLNYNTSFITPQYANP